MVGVAQLVEHKVVALVAAGSSPVAHPKIQTALKIAIYNGAEQQAPVAQLDRASASEAEGRGFDSRRARQIITVEWQPATDNRSVISRRTHDLRGFRGRIPLSIGGDTRGGNPLWGALYGRRSAVRLPPGAPNEFCGSKIHSTQLILMTVFSWWA